MILIECTVFTFRIISPRCPLAIHSVCALKNSVVFVLSPGTVNRKRAKCLRQSHTIPSWPISNSGTSCSPNTASSSVSVSSVPVTLPLPHPYLRGEELHHRMKRKLNYSGDITCQLFPWRYTSLLVPLITHR